MRAPTRYVSAVLLAGLLAACGGSGTPTRAVTLSWNENRESGVNEAGGGYRVSVTGQPTVDVPYVSGAAAPTTTVVQLLPGTYTVSVVAYAALDVRGGTSGSVSAPSQSITVTVP